MLAVCTVLGTLVQSGKLPTVVPPGFGVEQLDIVAEPSAIVAALWSVAEQLDIVAEPSAIVAALWSVAEQSVTAPAGQSAMVAPQSWFPAEQSAMARAGQSAIEVPPWFAVEQSDIVAAPSAIVAGPQSVAAG
jgi:hypothetical protein